MNFAYSAASIFKHNKESDGSESEEDEDIELDEERKRT
jgi:hypothetical protein